MELERRMRSWRFAEYGGAHTQMSVAPLPLIGRSSKG